MEKTYIYILRCPETDEVRYVGKSNDPKRRYYGHLREDRTSTTHKKNWIKSLLRKDLKPVLEVVKKVFMDEWRYWERYYIQYYKDVGHNIINHTDGGDGLSMGNQTSFKKGLVPWNTGTRMKKQCVVCGEWFEVSPSEDKKYKCCSMECSSIYRKTNFNTGKFQSGIIPWNVTSVIQVDKYTSEVITEYASIKDAFDVTGIYHISCVINGNRKTAGGFKWKRKENLENVVNN